MFLSSGETAKETDSDEAFELIPKSLALSSCRHVRVVNEGAVPGFVSFDGGNVKHRFAASGSTPFYDLVGIQSVQFYRDSGTGLDVTGVYASAW